MPLRSFATLADALGIAESSSSDTKRPRVGKSRHSLPGSDNEEEEAGGAAPAAAADHKEEEEKVAADESKPSPPAPTTTDIITQPDVPCDLWASNVMPFLSYVEMITCTAISRPFLRDVVPHVTAIVINSPREMKAAPARRFRGVERVQIGCLYRHTGMRHDEEDEDSDLVVDHGVVGLVAPFLPLFPALKVAQIGLYDPFFKDYNTLESAHQRTDESDRLMQTLQTSICGAYRARTISSNVEVIGVDSPCPNYENELDGHELDEEEHGEDELCPHCVDYCQSYPMKTVADASHCKAFPVCLSVRQVVNIVLQRPGGREYLTTPEYFIRKHIDLAIRESAFVEVLREMNIVPEKITRQDVENILNNKNGWSIAHTCNEQEFKFFHESGITCLERSDFRSILPEAPSDTRSIWW